ncbi:MAG: flagellar biosynthesis protein FlhA [Litorimonas sp.]
MSSSRATIGLAVGLMAVIVMMILPMPSWVLDMGVAISFAFAILIFTMTLFVEKPLDFSAFASVLLASLLLRLSLNVSSTKLIIGQGHTGTDAAGSIIEGFAMFVMGGNVAIGLIVFSVLVIVNFMVITKGAGRMAEVGARFALDAMPGKQMAIDSDLAAGAISHEEASRRREREQEETAFLGSLDGVSKFMKGDAIAGILITLLNLIAGMAIGVMMHDLSFSQAASNYAILTVGDGLVSQIPAVIISIAAGLLLSRGRGDGAVDLALLDQFGRHPAALAAVAGIMVVFAAFPGLPVMPFLIGAAGLGAAAYIAWKRNQTAQQQEQSEADAPAPTPEPTMGDMLDLDELSVELSRDLVATVMGTDFGVDKRIQKIRKYIATQYGFILPPIRLSDDASLPRHSYRIRLHGADMATQTLRADKQLALIEAGEHTHIPGDTTQEPVFKAPARWVEPDYDNELTLLGVTTVAPVEVLATHLLEVIQDNLPALLTRRALRETLDAFKTVTEGDRADGNKKLMEEFFPDKAPVELLHSVMRLLLEERISVRNLPLLMETVADGKSANLNAEAITDVARQRLSRSFVSQYRNPHGQLPIIRIGDIWTAKMGERETRDETGRSDIALSPDEFNQFAQDVRTQLDTAARSGTYAVIAAPGHWRRFVRSVLKTKGVKNPVLSYAEIAANEKPLILGAA